MRVLLKRRAIIIASTAVLIAVVTMVTVNLFNNPGPVAGMVNVISNPLRTLASNVASTFEGIYNSIYSYERLMGLYEEALRRNHLLERLQIEAIELAEENARLRELLDFRERHAEYQDEAATVREWSSSNWVSEFIINRGYSNSLIEVGHAVVTEYGVVIGQISRVDAITSTVVTVLDTRFSLSVNIGDADGLGTLRGDFNQMHSGLMVLDNIDDDLLISVGDRVATSGHGGVFPPGLVVGTIHEFQPHITGIGRYATVIPIRDINTISSVFVIIEFGEAGLDVY
jgi:rod shape-determining protein MreC